MAEVKKFYWLKLKRDFFKRHDIRIIEEMENGKDYILFYLKMLLESIDHEGHLRFSETIPYNEKMLSVITNTNVDVVRSALKVFSELNMLEIFDDQTVYMTEVTKLIGFETEYAKKKKEYRQKLLERGQSEDNSKTIRGHFEDNVRQEIEKEIDIELDKEIEKDKKDKPSPRPRFIKPTLEEVQAYCNERNNNVDAQRFIDYYSSNGWKVGKNPMKDWKAAVRTWENNGYGTSKPKATEQPKEQGSGNFFIDMMIEEGYVNE